MVFNGTNTGIVYMMRQYAKANSSDLSTQDIVNYANLALDEIYVDLPTGNRTLLFDDPNYADDPYEPYTITSGTRRYSMATDGNSASVLGIRRVALANSAGLLNTLTPIGLDDPRALDFIEGRDVAGVATEYIQMGTTIVLPNTPDYTLASALKVFYDRHLKYFTSSDTTATPGFALPYHELIPLIGANRWAIKEGKMTTANAYSNLIEQKKEDMRQFYLDKSILAGGNFIRPAFRNSR